MDTSPLTLTCCLVLDFTPSFASSCFVLYVYNKLNNFLRAGYFWTTCSALLSQLAQGQCLLCHFSRGTATLWYLHGALQIYLQTTWPQDGYEIFYIFYPHYLLKRLCKGDRGGKCTQLSAFQQIIDCNSATSGLHLLHHACAPRNPCKCFPTLCTRLGDNP